MTDELKELCTAMANVVAHLAGGRAVDIWPSYGRFEEDMCTIAGALGDLEDTAKPILEERARRLRGDPQAGT